MRPALFAAAALLLWAGAACAQDVCSGGHPVFVRVSKIKPGQAALFAKAVADQQAWYRGHGITTNQQMFGAVFTPTGVSPDQVMTVHMDAPLQRPATDAGWNAFIQEFHASSDMVSETRACVRAPQ